ncbi:MAG: HEAT repeat domain-containing protein [Planctomycetes bacterium]|nr:HEAT repeat domain-containing protein [Planctomycetota bacterium]
MLTALSWLSGKRSQAEGEADIPALLNEGITKYKEGNAAEALALLEKVFALDPTGEAIATAMDQVMAAEILRLVRDKDPRISGAGLKLLDARRTGIKGRIHDPEKIKAAIDETFAASPQDQLRLMIQHATEFGRNLVPQLIAKLGDSEIETRTRAELWIAHYIGVDAVPVLAAAAGHPEPLVRNSVARLLGAKPMRHEFSVAPLALLYQTDKDAGVKAVAKESLIAILGRGQTSEVVLKDAKLYYLDIARFLYLNPHKNDFNKPYYQPTIYHLKDNQVVEEAVADFQVNERMAEQMLVQALKLDPGFRAAREMALCNDALQLVEYQMGLEFYSKEGAPESGQKDVKSALNAQKATMDYLRQPRLLAAPKDFLFGAIGQALDDRMNEVAEKLLEVAGQTQRRGAMPAALLAALRESNSKTVRVHAAMVLADWNADEAAGKTGEAVVNALAEAIVNSGIRTVHKMMGNPEHVRRFDGLFQELNLESLSNSPNAEMGIVRASQIPPDLIVVDTALGASSSAQRQAAPINFLVSQLRRNQRTASVPIVVVVDPAHLQKESERYQSEENKVLVIPEDVDAVNFKETVLAPLFEKEDAARAKDIALASLAARSLERLTAGSTRFTLDKVAGALEPVLVNRPDSIRIPCLGALGNLRGQAQGMVGSIAKVFESKENSPEVREAAMWAVGKILDGAPAGADASLLKIILDGMNDTNLKLRQASYFAYSAAQGSMADQIQLLFETAPPAVEAPAAEKAELKEEKKEEAKPAEEAKEKEAATNQ